MVKNALCTKEAGQALGEMLKSNSILTELDVSANYDWDAGATDGVGFAKGIADGIENNGAMKSLNIGNNFLQAEGAKHIAAALPECK